MTRARLLSAALLSLALCPAALGLRPAAADPINTAFLPPEIVPQDICRTTTAPDIPEDPTAGDEMSDEDAAFLQYLRRDIRNLSAEDAGRWFDFILALIDWQEELDPSFAGPGADLARAALHVDAGQLDVLWSSGLLQKLRDSAASLSGVQKVALAQYFLNGTGIEADVPFGLALIRDAAYGGNVDALLTIARMDVNGDKMPEWDAPLDLTVSLAFGGMLGAMTPGICARAERVAAAYDSGDIVARNPAIAYAWRRFVADLGGTEAAWKVAEANLTGLAPNPDAALAMQYLKLAADRGYRPDASAAATLRAATEVPKDLLTRLLGPGANSAVVSGSPGTSTRRSLSHLLQLEANPDAIEVSEDGPYLQYLRRIAEFPTAPGFVYTQLANELMIKEGRWAAQDRAMSLLDEAARRGDPEGMRMLAQIMLRYRDDPTYVARAVSLLSEAATRHGDPDAMQALDGLFRCQIPEAPQLAEADIWAAAFRATGAAPVDISANDLLVLDPYRDPEAIAAIQTHALQGEVQGLSQMLERVQVDPSMGDAAHRIWAARTETSNKALELFADLEFALATTPVERDLAVALFRRVYLNNGVTSALDLAAALVEYNGRDPVPAKEIVTLLTQAGNRGEGNSIRLLARLTSDRRAAASLDIPPRTEAEVYEEFAETIETRGDFLALMFAIPHVSPAVAEDYIDRAVSLMVCGTKDIEELGDAHAILQDAAMTWHWRQVGLTIEGGHTLSRLAITNRQMDLYGTGAAPGAADVLARTLAEGDATARRGLYGLLSNPNRTGYDPARAAEQLVALLRTGDPGDADFVLASYREAPREIRAAVDAAFDLRPLLRKAGEAGDAQAQYDLAMLLRARASGAADLAESARLLTAAAEGGNGAAMTALAGVLANGLGVPADRKAAIGWYKRASEAGDRNAAEMARLLALLP